MENQSPELTPEQIQQYQELMSQQAKPKKPRKQNDKRSQTSRDNLAKARQAKNQKLAMLKQQKTDISNAVTIESSSESSGESSGEEEIVIKSQKRTRGKKSAPAAAAPQVQSHSTDAMVLMNELNQLKQMLLAQAQAKKKPKKERQAKIVQIMQPTAAPVPVSQQKSSEYDAIKKSMLLKF